MRSIKIGIIILGILGLFGMAGSVFASGWTEQTGSGSKLWRRVASSADGTKLVATPNTGYIYTSIDSGVTWTERTGAGSRAWGQLVSSDDGAMLAVAVTNGYIYTSADSGVTWTERTGAGSRAWTGLATSADGMKLVAGVGAAGGYIYTSTDGGVNWTERTGAGSRSWQPFASSADGTKLFAAVTNGYLYTSTDSGVNWTEQTAVGTKLWTRITASTDGTKLAALVSTGIYTSPDSGATWTLQSGAGTRNWNGLAASADGTKLVAVVGASGGYIYLSEDSGVNWTEQTSAGSKTWGGAGASSDGSKFIVGVGGISAGYIHTYLAPPVAPTVTTGSATSTTTTTVTLGGNITATGGEDATSHGIEYGTTISYGQVSGGGSASTGTFTRDITGLTCATTYHYRAFATNTAGTGLGSDATFTTSTCPAAPSVTTGVASSITTTTATLGGEITSAGTATPTIRGFQYGTTNSYGSDLSETGSFSAETYTLSLTGIVCNTTYYFRAYATNSVDTSYGSETTFATSACPVTSSANQSTGVHYGCKDPKATNYERFAASKPELCNYASVLSAFTATRLLKMGTIGDDVKTLQNYLNKQGFSLTEDGKFGPLTRNAVIEFQKNNALVTDGIVGPKTVGAMGATQ